MTTIPSNTPPEDTNNGTKVESTLQSRGTASRTMFNEYERSYLPDKARSIEIDLEGRQKVEFVSLLKALLARMLLGESADGKDTVALETAKSDADQLFDEMLEDAVNFCNSSLPTSAKTSPELSRSEIALETKLKIQNSTRSGTSQRMKSHLKDFCEAKSRKQRSLPISTAINTIMVEYDGHLFGQLPCLNDHRRIIVIPNDPLVIESLQLRKDSPATKHKADNIIVQLSHLLKLDYTCKDSDYRSWVQLVETESEKCKWALKGTGKKTSWLDVHCSIELDAHRVIESALLDQPMSKDQVLGGTSSTPASDVLQSSGTKSEGKRQASQSSSSSTGAASSRSCEKKRNHADVEESQTETTSSHKKRKTSDPDPPRFPAEIQCAYYAIEHLRGAWNVTHSIVLLIEDSMLSLRWYDTEGCIMTEPIDIIGQLPLFVVMVIILQRFDAVIWGFSDIEISQTTENGPVSFCLESDKAKGTRFQLVGRRTFGADVRSSDVVTSHVLDSTGQSTTPQGPHDASSNAPITTSAPPSPSSIPNASNTQTTPPSFPVPQQSSQNTPSDLPGSTRESHPLFFKAAWPENSQDREPQIIAEAISRANQYFGEFKAYVLEHVPTVVSWQEVKFTSTAIIRQLLGLPVELSRTLLWMVCHKLYSIEKCNGQDFWKAFWELIRCHYLLWCIGIAHGDISNNNLMYDVVVGKGILNDFDLAALMNPGDVSPQKKGWERTGTQPFMALELLDKTDGSVKRRYWHDLESFAWCLLWCGMNETFPDKAIYGSTRDVLAYKTRLGLDVREKTAKPGLEAIWPCIVDWVPAWVWRSFSFTPALEDDEDFVREFVEIVGKHEQAISLDDPQLKWVDFQVPLQAPSSSKDANVGDVTVSYAS